MGLLRLIIEWRWYHLLSFWLALLFLFVLVVHVQSPLLRGMSVFLPYPNSARTFLSLLQELRRASPLLLVEVLSFLAVGLVVTITWVVGRF